MVDEVENRARMASLQLWGQLLVNTESFPDEKFVGLGEALERAGTSLDVLRREVFTIYFFAFEFAILNSVQKGDAVLAVVRNYFIKEALEFVSKNADRWGKPEDFLLRMNSYRNALSAHLDHVKSSGSGNILEPIRQIFWPSVMDQKTTGRLLISDAQSIKRVTDQVLETFLPLTQLACRELQVAGFTTHSFK